MKNKRILSFILSIIPFCYTVRSRYDTVANFASWLLSFPVFYFLLFGSMDSDYSFLDMLAYFVAINLVYEVGYIYNDKVTIRKEANPTLRASFCFIDENHELVIILKLLLAFIISLCCFELKMTFGLMVLLLAFIFHNEVRSKLNILTYTILFFIKTLVPVAFFLNDSFLLYLLTLVVVIPRVIEHMTRNRYGLNRLKQLLSNRDYFRIFYTCFSFILIYLISFLFDSDVKLALIVCFYLMSFKILARLVKQKKMLKIKKHPDYDYK